MWSCVVLCCWVLGFGREPPTSQPASQCQYVANWIHSLGCVLLLLLLRVWGIQSTANEPTNETYSLGGGGGSRQAGSRPSPHHITRPASQPASEQQLYSFKSCRSDGQTVVVVQRKSPAIGRSVVVVVCVGRRGRAGGKIIHAALRQQLNSV